MGSAYEMDIWWPMKANDDTLARLAWGTNTEKDLMVRVAIPNRYVSIVGIGWVRMPNQFDDKAVMGFHYQTDIVSSDFCYLFFRFKVS